MTEPTWSWSSGTSQVTHIHQWIPNEPVLKVKLERGQKGTYSWEITYEGTNTDDVLARIRDVNNRLKREYAQLEEQKEVK